MQLLTVAVAFLLAHTVHGECGRLDKIVGVSKMEPFKSSYPNDYQAIIFCIEHYVVSWAATDDQVSGAVKCVNDEWTRADDPTFAGDIRCGACTDAVTCTEGSCDQGECTCNDNFEITANPRVCAGITCDAPQLTRATAEPDLQVYDVTAIVTVKCEAGYHIQGEQLDVTEKEITCQADGYFTSVPGCTVCEDAADCTGGDCNNGRCECSPGYTFAAGSLNVCEEVTCTEDYCKNSGVCSVTGNVLTCACPEGTVAGGTCDEFNVFPCTTDPCLNEGVCTRDILSDPTDLTKRTCACTDQFRGLDCEYAAAFHISTSDRGVVMQLDISSVEFDVNVAGSLPDMYIALLQVKDTNNELHKVVLKNIGDSSSITLSITKNESPFVTSAETIDNLDLSTRSVIKIYIDDSTSFLKVDIDDQLEYNSDPVAFNSITEVRFGGNLGNCEWDATSCTIGSSRVKYGPFVGTVYVVTIDGAEQTFALISSNSNDKAVANAMDCSTFACENEGTCVNTEGVLSCGACPPGFTGFNCDEYSGVSFNGYTSSFTSANAVVVPLAYIEQSLVIEFDKSAGEVGEIAKLTLGVPGDDGDDSCTLTIHAAGGNKYTLGDQEVTVDGSSLIVTFDGTIAKIGDVSSPCTWTFSSAISSNVEVALGGSDPAAGSGVTKSEARYQGCIKKVSVNGVDLLVKGATLTDVDTETCVTDYLPPDPCTPDLCQNKMVCNQNLDDYSASCTCVIPYDEDALCNRKEYCVAGHQCAVNGVCNEFDTIEECKETLDADQCGEGERWYYYCKCAEGWQGENCDDEIAPPTEKPPTQAPVKGGNNTTTIIVVVVIIAVVIGVVVVIIVVRRRKSGTVNGTANGKSKGTYSPQAQEKDLELAGKKEEKPEKNIYDNPEVIKNPNAESPAVEEASPPPTKEPAPADTTVTIEPEGDAGSRGPEGPPPDPI